MRVGFFLRSTNFLGLAQKKKPTPGGFSEEPLYPFSYLPFFSDFETYPFFITKNEKSENDV